MYKNLKDIIGMINFDIQNKLQNSLHQIQSRINYIFFSIAIICVMMPLGCQSSFVYFPDRDISETPQDKGLNYESVCITTKDREKISGWWIPSKFNRGVLLFFHGNAGNISHRLDSIILFNKLGLSTFIIDYRGFGSSSGKPSEKGTYLDASAAWDYLVHTRKVPQEDIIIFGRSLGGSIASWLAQDHRPRILILESAFTTIHEAAINHYPSLLVRLILKYKYSTIQYIRNVRCPLLIIHSIDDEIIPFDHGKKLYEVGKDPKEFITIRGSHNEGFIISGKKYEFELNTFISKYVYK
ncbi:MAG: alpha/beta hydrolase [Spirochaetota bacterium]|nr:alpha/beta hydrolase [Spirochaetota bacterium]